MGFFLCECVGGGDGGGGRGSFRVGGGGGGGETWLSMFLYYAYMVKLAKHYTIHVQDNKYM